MDFDFPSFVFGAVLASGAAYLMFKVEDSSIANRIAYDLLQAAHETIQGRYRAWHLENPNSEIVNLEDLIFPIENDHFFIQKVHALTTQSDLDIQSYTSVYSKQYDVWFLIRESYDCENIRSKYFYYASNQNFEVLKMIGQPYEFDLARHLKS